MSDTFQTTPTPGDQPDRLTCPGNARSSTWSVETGPANTITRSRWIRALGVTATVLLVGSGTVAAAASDQQPSAVTASGPTANKDPMRDVARQVLAAGAPGFVARIDDGHRVATTVAGLADLATGRPLTSRDQFEIGSNTKTFMSTLALQLVDRRQLDLDAPVSTYLPGVVPNGENITVRMLLNHTSGLFSYTSDPDFIPTPETLQRVWTEEELLDIAFKHEPDFAPGTSWSYSNTNYILIGMILQKQTGKSLPDLVEQRIARPLALKHTYFANPRATNTGPGYAHGYAVSFAGSSPTYTDTSDLPLGGWAGAAGAVISTSNDLSRFFSAVLGGKLFSQKQLNQMKTTIALPDGGGYGLGLFKIESPCGTAWGHGGDTIGHHSTAMASADGRRTAVSDTTALPGDMEPNDGAKRFYEVVGAVENATICEMLGKPVPPQVTNTLNATKARPGSAPLAAQRTNDRP